MVDSLYTAKECLDKVVEQYRQWYPEPITYTAWNGKEYTKDYKGLLQLFFLLFTCLDHITIKQQQKNFLTFTELNYE